MGKALYRKYRPKSLTEVVGQTQVTDILSNSIKSQKISHAYLFAGPRGTGKTSVARIFAHEINGFKYELEDSYVDIIEIDGASNRGIDNIRELRDKVIIAPTQGKYKIYIIDEVHMLTREAFNALLKTLEEPPAHVIFIMATTDPEKVPITITSRSQIYTFQLASEEQMFTHLKGIATKESIDIDDEALEIVVSRGGGSFRDSLSLLDQISSIADGKITRDVIEKSFGLPKAEKIQSLLAAYKQADFSSITTILKELISSGVKPESIASDLIEKIIISPTPNLLPLLGKLPEVKAPFAEAKILVAMLPQTTTQPTMGAQPVAAPQTAVVAPSATSSQPAKATKPAPKPAATKPTPEPEPTPTATDGAFDWNDFIKKLAVIDSGTISVITKCNHQLEGNILHIYPNNSFAESHFKREPHKSNLNKVISGIRVKLHSYKESANTADTYSKISGIMGAVQEVNNDGGEIPF